MRASIAPFTRTGIPTRRLASASNTERYWLQSMNSGANQRRHQGHDDRDRQTE